MLFPFFLLLCYFFPSLRFFFLLPSLFTVLSRQSRGRKYQVGEERVEKITSEDIPAAATRSHINNSVCNFYNNS